MRMQRPRSRGERTRIRPPRSPLPPRRSQNPGRNQNQGWIERGDSHSFFPPSVWLYAVINLTRVGSGCHRTAQLSHNLRQGLLEDGQGFVDLRLGDDEGRDPAQHILVTAADEQQQVLIQAGPQDRAGRDCVRFAFGRAEFGRHHQAAAAHVANDRVARLQRA